MRAFRVGSRTAKFLKGKAKLLLIDPDKVGIENIGCQLYKSKDNGKSKVFATSTKTGGIPLNKKLTAKNANTLLKEASVIADCTDNWTARKTIDDYCAKTGKKWVYAGAIRTYAMVSTISKPGSFTKWGGRKTKSESCHIVGISTKACGWAAKTQAREVEALLKGRKPKLEGKIEFYDVKTKEKELIEV